MKKIITSFMMITVIVLTSSFTTEDSVETKECIYNMSYKGKFLGQWSINVPVNMSCGSKEAKALALADFAVWG